MIDLKVVLKSLGGSGLRGPPRAHSKLRNQQTEANISLSLPAEALGLRFDPWRVYECPAGHLVTRLTPLAVGCGGRKPALSGGPEPYPSTPVTPPSKFHADATAASREAPWPAPASALIPSRPTGAAIATSLGQRRVFGTRTLSSRGPPECRQSALLTAVIPAEEPSTRALHS